MSNCRAPWFDTHTASAPNSTARRASSAHCTPFTITVDATSAEVTGYNSALLMASLIATGLAFSDGTLVTDGYFSQLDFGLKPVGGDYFNGTTQVEASTSDANIEYPANGGEFRDLDPSGSQHFEDRNHQSLNDFNLNVAEGSIVIVSGSVCTIS